jgi:hypothetical protein
MHCIPTFAGICTDRNLKRTIAEPDLRFSIGGRSCSSHLPPVKPPRPHLLDVQCGCLAFHHPIEELVFYVFDEHSVQDYPYGPEVRLGEEGTIFQSCSVRDSVSHS